MNKIFLSQLREIKKDSIRFKKEIKESKKNLIKNNNNFSIDTENLFFDFSRNIIDDKSLSNLVKLAEIVDIKSNFKKLCSGESVNISEKRKVLHPAMRDTNFSLDQDITDDIVMHKMMLKKISEDINSGRKTSFSNKKFTDVVSIGTGGSYFGIKMLYAALKNYAINDINLHFISNLDSSECKDTLEELNPETTLFILVSK